MKSTAALEPVALDNGPTRWLDRFVPADTELRERLRLRVLRVLIAANLALGFYYITWRFAYINWAVWPLSLALLAAETYGYVDAWLFGLGIWRQKRRAGGGPPPPGATVDVFITCYNEPVDLVRRTARAARSMRYPHNTYILDDGNSSEMRAMAAEEGVKYVVRSEEWAGRNRHAKAGNISNALLQSDGEFILFLDADQVPYRQTLDQIVGYFRDPQMALVQTPQVFYNVPKGDPFNSQAPFFYGPIQQGKDGWNAAFFCGSNAMIRREALMHVGIRRYVWELERRVKRALDTAGTVLRRTERQLTREHPNHVRQVLNVLRVTVADARRALRSGHPIQEVTWRFQQDAQQVAELLVRDDLARIRAELKDIPGLDADVDFQASLSLALDDDATLALLAGRQSSPLAAIETVRSLLLAVDVDRDDEAQPVMPMSTISVTEDMATAMRLHAAGWTSAYHHEVLVVGLAPEDLRTALQQRLRWAQGTIQVMLRENPLCVKGLSWGQRVMYFSTGWIYLSGFFAVVFLVSPVLYLLFGVLPVRALSADFFWHLAPYLVANQLLFTVAGWGKSTWRGQQYSLALFPLWIEAVISACQNVWFGKKLGFVVTPKTRPGAGATYFGLVRIQLGTMAVLLAAAAWGLGRLALGLTADAWPILINVAWIAYDLLMLSAVVKAATFQPAPRLDPQPPTAHVAARMRALA
ncbi:MAG: Cellulose synthase catalytic subunit [uncultured Chloroflexi bacterium]|uniref:Cellulose synthase catalytic subunit n=1 Tax=uncultured Chloroflexota bacterium TaxID=166587 RepID=A0A6J4H857_9CHLR|nr:MAG: Cellulose synthase catalytic subunit [uncultured Chloroflexota bacterium]